jgi:carbamoyltransferase
MIVLGLSFDYHDSAAALIRDGQVIAAAQEERFSRKKNDPRFPKHAIDFCLEQAGIRAADLDRVIFYEKPFVKFDRIVKATLARYPESRNYFRNALRSWSIKKKFLALPRIIEHLGIPFWKVRSVSHHDAHAGAAFFCSPFNEATILTIDGVGEYETMSIAVGRGGRIRKIASMSLPHSIGLFYSAFTAFLGFEVNEGEYKVMGMAGFGKPVHAERLLSWFSFRSDGTFRLKQDYFNFLTPEELSYTPRLVEELGPPREAESLFNVSGDPDNTAVQMSRHYADIAASVQKVTEEVILRLCKTAVEQTGIQNLCMAGGVAMNSLANGRVKHELGLPLFVHPAAGDSGSAIGAALFYTYRHRPGTIRTPMTHGLWGREYSDQEIAQSVKETYMRYTQTFASDEEICDVAARLLHQGSVIGWVQGRFEWGPRALGARSILANPVLPGMQAIVNEKIKFREPFRPFAPSVLEERASEYFEIGRIDSPSDPEHFMLAICPVRADKRSIVPSITHVDGTARVQLVKRIEQPIFYGMIEKFAAYSGVPMVMNTSFNLRGEPIVNTPKNAIKTFEWSGMDYLVLGRTLVAKNPIPIL